MCPWPGPASSRSHSPSTTAPATPSGLRRGRRTARSGRRSSARPRTTTTAGTRWSTSSRPRRRWPRSAAAAPTTTSPTTRCGRSCGGLGAADLTPDDDHRFDLDGVYDIAAENPDRWAVDELAATIDIVSRLAECLDTSGDEDDEDDDDEDDDEGPVRGGRRARGQARDRLARPRRRGVRRPRPARTPGSASAASSTTCGRTSSTSSRSTSTGPAPAPPRSRTTRRPRSSRRSPSDDVLDVEELDDDVEDGRRARRRDAGREHDQRRQPDHRQPGGGRRGRGVLGVGRHPARRGRRARGRGADAALLRRRRRPVPRPRRRDLPLPHPGRPRPLHRRQRGPRPGGDRLLAGGRRHRRPAAARPSRTATTSPSCPRCSPRSPTAPPGWSTTGRSSQPVEGVRDLAEYAGIARVEELLAPSSALGRAVARAERDPDATLRAEDAGELKRAVGRGRHPGQQRPGLPRLSGPPSRCTASGDRRGT